MSAEHESIGANQPSPRNGYANGVGNGRDPSGNVLDLVDASARRQDDLREAESRHFREVLQIRSTFEDKLRTKESERLDAIRSNDQASLQTAATTAEMRANTLAATVATSAEALRTQVQDAAAASTLSLAAALSPIQVDVSELRKAQYQTQGEKTQVVESREKGMTAAQWIGVAIAITAVFLSTIMIVVTIIAILTKGFTQ